jgi:hypothetical protein
MADEAALETRRTLAVGSCKRAMIEERSEAAIAERMCLL